MYICMLLQKSLKEVLELGLAGVPMVSMLACGDRSMNVEIPEDIDKQGEIAYVDELCLRWYQLAAYMPALRSSYGGEKHNTIVTDNNNLKWIKRSLSHRIMVSKHKNCYAHLYVSFKEY